MKEGKNECTKEQNTIKRKKEWMNERMNKQKK